MRWRWTQGGKATPRPHAVRRSARGGLACLLALFVFALVASAPASAHRPYFTRVEKIVLPDGQPGEMRLLHGDGIIVSDPIRILVLDAEGRLLARSRQSQTLTMVCEGGGRCRGVDLGAGAALELDPASFRSDGPLVPGLGDRDRDGLWSLERGEEGWGFKARRIRAHEKVWAEFSLARQHFAFMAFLVALGFVAAGLALVGPRRPLGGQTWRLVLWAAVTLVRLVGCAIIALVSLLLTALLGLTDSIWLGSLAAGAAVLLLVRHLVRSRSTAAG